MPDDPAPVASPSQEGEEVEMAPTGGSAGAEDACGDDGGGGGGGGDASADEASCSGEGEEDAVQVRGERVNWLKWLGDRLYILHPHPDPATDPQEWVDGCTMLGLWYFVMAVHLCYIAVFLPIRICFYVQDWMPYAPLDALADCLHFVDMWVKLRTAVSRQGFFITNRKEIQSNYLRSMSGGFVFDLICGLPYDYPCYLVLGYSPYFRVNRLLRMVYFGQYFRLFESYNPRISTNIIRLVKSTLTMLFVAHILGCGFFLVLRLEGPKEDGEDVYDLFNGSLIEHNVMLHPGGGRTLQWQGYYDLFELSVPRQYIRAVYWAFISMTGYGNTIPVRTPETLYTILVTLCGLSVYVNVIGTVGSLVSSIEATTQAHRTRMDTFNDWMKYRRIPDSTQKKVKAYYDYMWLTRKGVEEQQLLEQLPMYLHLEVAKLVNNDIIEKVPLFKDVSREFLNAIILHMQPSVVMAGAYICKTGDVGAEMFFISSGAVNIVIEEEGKEDKVVATLTDGCFFGEVALIYQTKRTATVVAHTVCELYILKKVHFEEVLDEFPDYGAIILEKAAERHKAAAESAKRRQS